MKGAEAATSSSARGSGLRPEASTRTACSPDRAEMSTSSARSVTTLPAGVPDATSPPPTSIRAEVTGPPTVARTETEPESSWPSSGAHAVPSLEYSIWPITGLGWSFRTASRASRKPLPRYSLPSQGAFNSP